jgi:hypothetical protein
VSITHPFRRTPEEQPFRARLARVRTGRARPRRSPALLAGSVLAPLGLVLVALAWLGASRTPVLQEQVAYLVSGGLGGVCLVVLGGLLYFSHWQTEQVHETRAQTAEVVAALREVTATLERVAAATQGAATAAGSLVATPSGTLSHRESCQVVRSRRDLRHVAADEAGLTPCRLCQPTPT